MYRIRKQLIKSLSESLVDGINELGEKYQAVQLLPELKKDYLTQLRPEIVSVRMYQTEKICFLETTIDEFKESGLDPEEKNPAAPYQGYSRVIYRIRRESLAFMASDEEDSFWPHNPILDNAADFCMLHSSVLINCTDLFTDEGAKEIDEQDAGKEYDKDFGYLPEELEFTGEMLQELDGYHSDDDPEFPQTPLATLAVEEDKTSIFLNQTDEHVDMGQPEVTGKMPSFLGVDSELYQQVRITTLTIPNNHIKNIKVKTSKSYEPDPGFPFEYEYFIELTTGEKIIVEGQLGDVVPEYWYYKHKIRVEKI